MDRLTLLASRALGRGRVVVEMLDKRVLPLLPPSQAMSARRLAHRIESGDFVTEGFLRDLDTFGALIQHMVAEETRVGWEADENHVRGGYDVVFWTDKAKVLASIIGELRALQAAIAETLDFVKAHAMVSRLAVG